MTFDVVSLAPGVQPAVIRPDPVNIRIMRVSHAGLVTCGAALPRRPASIRLRETSRRVIEKQ